MLTEQLLCWSGFADIENRTTSGSNEEDSDNWMEFEHFFGNGVQYNGVEVLND